MPTEPRVLDGRYRLEEPLGAGGTGTVWQAYDQHLSRTVALKTLHAAPSPAHLEAASALQSPHIIPLLDFGTAKTPDGRQQPYLVMPLVQGETLAQLLTRQSPLPLLDATRIARHVCQALTDAHAARVVHGDIGPSTIMLTPQGDAMVMDFGITNSPVEPAADIRSLGRVLYEMLTGRAPTQHPPSVRELRPGAAPGLARLTEHLLAENPESRPTAAEAARVLTALSEHGGPQTPALPAPATRRRTTAITAAAITAAVTALALGLFYGVPFDLGSAAKDLTEPAYTIAVVGDFEGDGKARAATAYDSVRMAAEDANRKDDRQFLLKVRKFDDQGSAEGAARAAEKVVAEERIAAVIGPVGDAPETVLAKASRIYARHDIVVINPWARQSGDLGSTTYQLTGDTGNEERAIAAFLHKLYEGGGKRTDQTDQTNRTGRMKKIRFFSDGEDDATALIGRLTVTPTYPGFGSATGPLGDDVAEEAREVVAGGYDAVFYAGGAETFEKLDAYLAEAGFKGLRLTLDAAVDLDYRRSARWFAFRGYCSWNDEFDHAYEAEYGEEADLGGVESYDAVTALAAAFAGVDRTARPEAVRDAVAKKIAEVAPAGGGLCIPDLRFGRDGFLLKPPVFLDRYELGENRATEVGELTGGTALGEAQGELQ
ncbi:bifunctional serine/threonine-protein kinase/ABC transporter substrate-binding protein [Streptomyces sp. NBC_01304]|uniref:bifunctional serine/threonine-protein kinase/ABC transporter substrate-binding protein n=1 Tax=Streptomyces sp. NBC_01304 TaxID=2903818 RepID=UPI002E109EB8|nr:bifunctional serine/threonine-protein kinase/ABC transporter substrate-binding protein [Streptomyces sp. NBC_01304]